MPPNHGMAIAGLADSSSVDPLSYLTIKVWWWIKPRNSSELPKIIWNQQMIRYIRLNFSNHLNNFSSYFWTMETFINVILLIWSGLLFLKTDGKPERVDCTVLYSL
jgi:hypothetical protein